MMNKKLIKNKLSSAFLDEASVPGLDVTKKAQNKADKFNKEYYKEVEGKMKDYDSSSKQEDEDAIEEPKTNIEGDTETYHQEMELMNGQEMIQYSNEPSERFKDRAEMAIAGDALMGNSPDYANVVPKQQGFTGPDFGKNLVKSIKASKKKRDDATPEFNSLGDDIENKKKKTDNRKVAVENKENNKPIIKESKMKRLRFKNPFDGLGNALKLIPESYRENEKVFEMTDGNESYKIRWEGSVNEGKAVVLQAADQNMVNEDVDKMKHLMGFSSKETLGTPKGDDRLNESSSFRDIMNKTKSLMTEQEEDSTEEKKNLNENVAADAKGVGSMGFVQEEQPIDEEEDLARDVSKATGAMAKYAPLKKALGLLNTRQELIQFIDKIVNVLAPDDSALKNAIAMAIKKDGVHGTDAPEEAPAEAPMAEGKGVIKSKNHADYVMTEDEPIEETDRFDEVFDGANDEINEEEVDEACGKKVDHMEENEEN